MLKSNQSMNMDSLYASQKMHTEHFYYSASADNCATPPLPFPPPLPSPPKKK